MNLNWVLQIMHRHERKTHNAKPRVEKWVLYAQIGSIYRHDDDIIAIATV